MGAFDTNQNLSIDVKAFGESRAPVLVIDGILESPAELVAAASAAPDWQQMVPGGYPGQRAALPGDYVRAILRRLDGPIRRKLVPAAFRLSRFDCTFSMVTRPPEALTLLQRVPHIDVANPHRVAVLHYLCGPGFGGTAFFRQLATGLEQVGPEDRKRYLAARVQGLSALDQAGGYPGTDTPGYTRTGFVEAGFNRLIAYPSCTLHSGIVDAPDRLTANPATGRLTATFFVDYAAPTP